MVERLTTIVRHLVPLPSSATPGDGSPSQSSSRPPSRTREEIPWPPTPPSRPFAGFETPTGKRYARGTSVSLMGNMEPVANEVEGELLPIHGKLPHDLDGFFIRNGPNPAIEQYGKPKYHEFEGDAMLHAVDLKNGKGLYSNRYVKTKRQAIERENGRSLGPMEKMDQDGSYLGTANTSLVYHANRLLALYEVDRPYILSLPKLETMGQLTCEELPQASFTAHPKVCPVTGDMVYFGYALTEPKVHYGVMDKHGKVLRSFDVATQGGKPVMMHDMAITTSFSILLEFPLYFEVSRAMKGLMPYVHDTNLPSRFGILPRYAESAQEIRWFSAGTGMSFHIANAWQEEEKIYLVGCPQAKFSFEYGDSCPSLLHEWVFDLTTGLTSERQLDGETHIEFPVINPQTTGKKTRYAWAAVFAGTGVPFHSICGCIKYDLVTGQQIRHDFLEGRWGGESVFAPAGNGAEEDDGFLLTYTYNPKDFSTELYVVDARTMDPNPVAILRTPQRVPFGFHANWFPREQL